MFRKPAIIAITTVVSLCTVSYSLPVSAKEPAVSGINGKLEAIGADVDSDSVQLGAASFSAPLPSNFGFQLDGATGEFASTNVNGYGVHLFWRDPELGLLGMTASRIGFGSTWGQRFGLEGEYYLGSFTFTATAGLQRGELLTTGYGNLDIRALITDDLALEAGGGFYTDERTGHVGMEWQPMSGKLGSFSFFADAGFGNHGYNHLKAGIRISLGGSSKALKDRQRRDDRRNQLIDAIMRIGAGAGTASGQGGSSAASGGPPPGLPGPGI